MTCPNCGAPCQETDHFCGNCGAVLSQPKKGSHLAPILILAVLSLIGIVLYFAIPMQAASDIPWFDVTQDGSLIFHQSSYDGSGELTVPEQVGSKTVYHLGDACFAGCRDLTAVELPDTLQSIGGRAFENCTALRGIRLPESVTVIGSNAFSGCTALEAITIPASVTHIDPTAFDDCDTLTHVFFDGTYGQWKLLAGNQVAPNANIYCTDGNYCQGHPIP